MAKGKKIKNLRYSYSGRNITAAWDFSTKNKSLDHYDIKWYSFNPAAKKWSDPATSTTKSGVSSISLGAVYDRAKIYVRPVQKKNHKGKKWTGDWYKAAPTKLIGTQAALPADPSVPTVEITGENLSAYIENYETAGATIRFYIVETNGSKTIEKYKDARVVYGKAMITDFKVNAGCYYRVRCRAYKGTLWSAKYSNYSSDAPTGPGKIPEPPVCVAMAIDEEENVMRVNVSWEPAPCVGSDEDKDSYEIEYTKNADYFDRSADDVSSVESKNITGCVAYITISDAGTYYFRVRGVNASGKGAWSEITSVTVGIQPEPPTTWSYSTSVAVGDEIIFNWTHNSADGSIQREAELQLTIITEQNEETEPIELDPISIEGNVKFYKFDTSDPGEGIVLSDGSKIEWKVRTKGVYKDYSEWSIVRGVYIFEQPTVAITMNLDELVDPQQEGETEEEYLARIEAETSDAVGKLTSFPLTGEIVAGPSSQFILSLDFTITADSAYTTEDDTGLTLNVAKGDPVYTKRYDNPGVNTIPFELDPGDISLESDVEYIASVTVGMSSGLDATYSLKFLVRYEDDLLDPDAEVVVDPESFTAVIRPYCSDEFGGEINSGAIMRVYRRNYDGTFTRITENEDDPVDISVGQGAAITDPHPALDYARYRVVAKSTATGQISYYDVPGEPINSKCIVLNWSEEWRDLENTEDEAIEDIVPDHSASMLILPYNVDVSENNTQDVSLVEYIGRAHPVSYYGTQKGYSASWKCTIPKTDTETLFALRRLARYAGDVYVREPSGAGYWAYVKVSYNIDHNTTSIPVTFDITRVEGGM